MQKYHSKILEFKGHISTLYIFIIATLTLISASANAGHMFTQASSNTPTWIQTGQGIAIDQYGDEGGTGSGNMNIYFEANNSVPSGADTSSNAWYQWSAGDVMRITLPLADATYTYTIAYDASSSCAYDLCGQTGSTTLSIASSDTTLGQNTVTLPTHTGERSNYTSSDVSFSWSIEALAGEFSLGGYRIYTFDGTIDGTGAGPLTQASVVSSSQVQQQVSGGGSSIPDIDTAQASYTAADLSAGNVNPKFTGGKLTVSSVGTVTSNFTIDSNGGEIETASGDVEFSGVISDDSSTTGGSLVKSGSYALTLSGANTFSGGTVVNAGDLVVDGSLAGGLTVNTNGRLKGSGTIAGATVNGTIAPGNSPGTLTSTSSIALTSTSVLQEEIDGLTYSASGGAGSYDRIDITGASSTFTADGTLEVYLRGISTPANNNFTPDIADVFRIVTTTNSAGVLGAFDTVTQPTSGLAANTMFDVVYGNSYIDLYVTPESYYTYAQTNGNQNTIDAFAALDPLRPSAGTRPSGNEPFSGLIGLTSSQLDVTMAQIAGEIHAQSLNSVKDNILAINNSLTNSNKLYSLDKQVWVTFDHDSYDYSSDRISTGYESESNSLIIGRDLSSEADLNRGIGFSYNNVKLKSDLSANSDGKSVSVFGYQDQSISPILSMPTKFATNAGVGLSYRKIKRSVSLMDGTNIHDSKVREPFAFADAHISSEVYSSGKSAIVLSGGLTAQFIRTLSYSETGDQDTALTVKGGFAHSEQASAGIRYSYGSNDSKLYGTVGLEVISQLNKSTETLDRNVQLNTANWKLNGTNVGNAVGRLSAATKWKASDKVTLNAYLVAEESRNRSHRSVGSAGLGISIGF